LTAEQFRARFPIFAHTVYVNSCSQGALSLEVRAALDAFVESWHTAGSPWDRWVGEVERLRALFATTIGADADEIAVMPSASAAIAAIATALSFDGDRRQVLLSEFEFPTMAHVWLAQQRRGAIVDRVPAHGETLPIAHYQTRIDERTLIVPAAHVCFRNGYRLDVVALASLCKKRGAYLMVDDYQRTGTAPIDVHALGVDVLATGALKYLLGPAGIAFLYVRRDLIERFEPLSTGWFGRVDPFAFSLEPLDWAASARRFETGTPPVPNVYAAAAGLDLLNGLGPAAIDAQIRRLTARMVDGALSRGFTVATPSDPEARGALVVVRCIDAGTLAKRLEARGIVASARGTGLRVSFHAYNNDDDVDTVLAALDAEGAFVGRQS
jgi:selenocysteine lyase/cysteine desulfurase